MMRRLLIFAIGLFATLVVHSAETNATFAPPGITAEPQPFALGGIPKGKIENFTFRESVISPGTMCHGAVFIPAQYDGSKPACVYVQQDGYHPKEKDMLEALIAAKDMPVTIGLFLEPGQVLALGKEAAARRNRCLEYDSLGDAYVRFLTGEVLPYVTRQYALNLSTNGKDRCIAGGSSGGIAAFNAAWERPDAFSRVYANWIRFYTPSECRNYVPPDGHVLVGDCHIVRGAVTVIGGPPGAGKSRAAITLSLAGKTLQDWYGLKVHYRFKTLVIQNENGRYRLSKDFANIQGDELDDFIRVSGPPANGMAFDRPEFRAVLAQYIEEFKPDVVILDPWNSAARDDRQKDYLETFQAIREVLPKGDNAPALVIVAHTRKPRVEERASGRALLNLLAGSYVLGSIPRSVFVMQPATDDVTDERIVWTCCKNNDGDLGHRSAWYRRNGLFEPCPDFDWKSFDGEGEKRRAVTLQDLEARFDGGKRQLPKAAAVTELMELTSLGKTACYEALKLDGKFAAHLSESSGLIVFKP